jgi:hypothetical protein
MMVQEVWHAAASTIKAALWTISTLEVWNATAAIISTLLAYAVTAWTYVSTSPVHLLFVVIGIAVLSFASFLISFLVEDFAKIDQWMRVVHYGFLHVSMTLLIPLFVGLLPLLGWLVIIAAQFLLSTYDRWWFVPALLTLTWIRL